MSIDEFIVEDERKRRESLSEKSIYLSEAVIYQSMGLPRRKPSSKACVCACQNVESRWLGGK